MLLLNLLTAKVNICLYSAALVGRFSPCGIISEGRLFQEDPDF